MRKESIQEKYIRLLDEAFADLQSNGKPKKNPYEQLQQYFETKMINTINKQNKMKVVFDNQLSIAIACKAQEASQNFNENFDRCEKKIIFLNSLNKVLERLRFISKREALKTQQIINKIKNHPQFRWNSELATLGTSQNQQQFRAEFMGLANKQIDIEDDQQTNKAYDEFFKQAVKNKINRKLLIKIDELFSRFEMKTQVLSQQTLDLLDEYTGKEIGVDDLQIQLNKSLMRKAQMQSLSTNQQHREIMNQQYQYLLGILNKFCSMKLLQHDLKLNRLHVAKFGSNVSGFASKNTDIDLTILTDCYIDEDKFLSYLMSFLEAQFKQKDKNAYKLELVKNARIPLIKLVLMGRNRQPFHFDIIVNNILGVINSKFLSVYGQIPWIKQLVILIKQWGKRKDLIKAQLFSSYGLTLMLIHFLIQTKKINLIMDRRLKHDDTPHFIYKRNVKGVSMQEFKVYFTFKTKKQSVTSLRKANLYSILKDFFSYYGPEGKHWDLQEVQRIISVDGQLTNYDSDCIFTIRDPFDERHNPGRVKETYKNTVMNKFKQAFDTMKSKNAKQIERLFEM